jgi:hypothetical protein
MRGIRVIAAASAALMSILALGACGSDTGSTASVGGTAANGEDQKSANDILTDVVAATARVPALMITATNVDASGSTGGGTIVSTPTGAQVTLTTSSGPAFIVVTGGTAYGASTASGPFQQATASEAASVQYLLLPNFAACLSKNHGTLTKGGTSTVDGKRVIEVKDDGSAPGSSPGSAFIALDGPPLTIQVKLTGPQKPGGDKSCGATDTSTTKSETDDLTYPATAPTITPPAAGSSSSTTS